MSWKTRISILLRHMRVASERGNAAIEFAFVAPAFFALMLGILEIGTMTFGQFALQNAVTETGRLIRTGQAQGLDFSTAARCMGGDAATDPGHYTAAADWYRGQICCNVYGLLQCDSSHLYINVSSAQTFAAAGSFSSATANVTNAYSPGAACDVVLVRATYAWTIWFPGLARLLNASNADYLVNIQDSTGQGAHLLSATTAFRNEPYTSGVNGC
jgi:Flp pilus assembly protein TadG